MSDAKKICFDLDGVLCSLTNGEYENAVPDPEAVQFVNGLYDRGFHIIIYTARFMGRNNQDIIAAYKQGYELTRSQLRRWGVKYHDLFLGKPAFDMLIDDRAAFYQADWRKIEAACGLSASLPPRKLA